MLNGSRISMQTAFLYYLVSVQVHVHPCLTIACLLQLLVMLIYLSVIKSFVTSIVQCQMSIKHLVQFREQQM